jgi:2-methylcitrate dehydratase PrpD
MTAPRGPTAELARFAVEWRPELGASEARRQATNAMIDLTGAMLAGATDDASLLLARRAMALDRPGRSAVVGHGVRLVAPAAAWVNGATGHAVEFDDVGRQPGVGHPSVAVIPAALAVAEEVRATGAELLDAVIVGFEVVARLGRAGGGADGQASRLGFHGTSVFGVLGAAAASARLLDLDPDRAACALGVAASCSAGLRANFGTMTKALHVADSNRLGVVAAQLASDGFDASAAVIEAPGGWAGAFAPSATSDEVIDALGDDLAIEAGLNLKAFPSCAGAHAATRTVLEAFRRHGLAADDVSEIDVRMSRDVAERVLMYEWPANPTQARFSLAFHIAAAWADGRVGLDTFTAAKIAELAPHRSRIRVDGVDGRPPVTVVIHTADGRRLTAAEPPAAVADEDTLRRKFHDSAGPVIGPDRAAAVLVVLEHLTDLDDLGELTGLLA